MTTIEKLKMLKEKVEVKDYTGRISEEYFVNPAGIRYGKRIQRDYNGNETISYYNDKGIIEGTVQVFIAATGILIKEYFVKNKIVDGFFKEYYKNGNLKFDGNAKNIRNRTYKHGTFKLYYDDGSLKEEGRYSMGKYFKKIKRYNKDGTLSYIKNFKRGGKLDGWVQNFTENSKYLYKDGKKVYSFKMSKDPQIKNIIKDFNKNKDKWETVNNNAYTYNGISMKYNFRDKDDYYIYYYNVDRETILEVRKETKYGFY